MAVLEVLAGLVLLAALLYYYATATFSHWSSRGVPHLPPDPLFGNIKDIVLFRDLHVYGYQKLYHRFDGLPYAGLYQMRTPSLMLRDPETIKQFLVKDFAHFHDRGIFCDVERDPMSATLVNLSGRHWRNLRNKLTPSFSAVKLKSMTPLLNECADALVALVGAGQEGREHQVEMREVMAKFTTDVIGTCAFGLHFNTLKDPDSQFREMGRRVFLPTYSRTAIHLLRVFFPGLLGVLRLRTVSREITDFFISLVRDVIGFRERNGEVRNDFMQLLMQLRQQEQLDKSDKDSKEDAVVLDDRLLTAQVFIFFVAGFETSSSTMSFCVYELAINEEVQELARQEVDAILSELDDGQPITYEHVAKMTYIEKVLLETMRKYPPVPGLVRVCTKPYTLPGTKVHMKVGDQVFIPTFAIQRDPNIFPEPDRFDPERFSEDGRKSWHPFAYLPFGEGPRICIGLRFAMVEMKMGLARLLQHYKLLPAPGLPVPMRFDPKAFVLTAEGGINVRVVPRSAAAGSAS